MDVADGDLRGEFTRQIVDRVSPTRVILLGSRARRDARPDSDYDFLVVMPDGMDHDAASTALHEVSVKPWVSRDLILTTGRKYRQLRNVIGTIEHEAAREGITVYPADFAEPPEPFRPPKDEEIAEVLNGFGERAASFLRSARLMEHPPHAAFSSHECAWQCIPAAYVRNQLEYSHLRGLKTRAKYLGSIETALAATCEKAAFLSRYEWATYPDGVEVDADGARSAVEMAEEVYAAIGRYVASRGMEWSV